MTAIAALDRAMVMGHPYQPLAKGVNLDERLG
jgi:hypothetical protein